MSISSMNMDGFLIREAKWMTVKQYVRVKRTRRERWFSLLYGRYWVPFRKTRIKLAFVPDPDVMILDGKILVMHPATLARLERELANEEQAD